MSVNQLGKKRFSGKNPSTGSLRKRVMTSCKFMKCFIQVKGIVIGSSVQVFTVKMGRSINTFGCMGNEWKGSPGLGMGTEKKCLKV
jgi:hypothetical protein